MSGFRPLFGDDQPSGFAPLRPKPLGAERPADRGPAGFRPLLPSRFSAAEAPPPPRPEPAPAPAATPPLPVPPPAPEPAEDLALLRLREDAWAAGHAAGLAAGGAEIATRLRALDALVAEVSSLRGRLFAAASRDVAAAVELIAAAVVHRELHVDSSGVQDLVVSVLQHVQNDDEVVIRVAPEDERVMQAAAPVVLDRLGRDATFRIQADGALQPGGVVVETRLGSIDASVETRFAAFAEAVAEWQAAEAADALR